GVRAGAVLGLDRGGLGRAWGYSVATQRVLWTSGPLPWPHSFVDPSGIGGSTSPLGGGVLLAICAELGARPRPGVAQSWLRPELARAGMQVMLVDRNGYSTFQPLLYQVATAGLNSGDVVYSARALTRKHGARFRLGELTGIDAVHRRITLADGGEFEYDYLVLA